MQQHLFSWKRPASLSALGSAIRRHRESLDLTLDALAALTAISKPYLSNIETARAPGPPSEEKIRRLAKALHLPAHDLLAGADWLRAPASIRKALAAADRAQNPRYPDGTINLDQLLTPHSTPNPQATPSANPQARGLQSLGSSPATNTHHSTDIHGTISLRNIPLINRVAAGHASEFTDLSYPAGIADQYVPAPDLPNAPTAAAFAVRVLGQSMAPNYREGDILIVGPADPKDGDDCVIRLAEPDNFATTFKRVSFQRDPDGNPTAITLTPLNPAFPTRTLPPDQITGIYPLLYRLIPAHPQTP